MWVRCSEARHRQGATADSLRVFGFCYYCGANALRRRRKAGNGHPIRLDRREQVRSIVHGDTSMRLYATFLLLALIIVSSARADGLLFSYDGNTLPGEPASGLQVDNPCEPDCSLSLADGYLVLEWGEMGERTSFSNTIAALPDSPPSSLWVEWRSRSNQPQSSSSIACDADVFVVYNAIVDAVLMFQNVAFDNSGDQSVPLTPGFHTYRFESPDGINYTLAIDGIVFKANARPGKPFNSVVAFGGSGSCSGFRPQPVRNEWDFVRHGTLGNGEQLVNAVPPSGSLTPAQANQLSSVVLTFDQPAHLYVDEIAVTTTGGTPPTVLATRRLDNGTPEVLEVVITGLLPPGETTTFTFDTGAGPQSVSYFREAPEVPATSHWGLLVTVVVALVAGSLAMSQRRDPT